jgi:hypothetical protein
METVKIFVGVKYVEKEEAKEKGCKWDKDKKGWYLTFPIDDPNPGKLFENVFGGGYDLKGYKPYKYLTN